MYILETIGSYCSDPGLATILSIIKKTINILQIIGPILAIVGMVIALIKLMVNPDEKKYKNLLRNSLTALIILLLLPTIVNAVMKMLDGEFELTSCWNAAEATNKVSGNDSHYINKYDRPSTNIYTDPDDYKPGVKPNNSSSTNGGTFVSSKNSIKYNTYYQTDSRWGSTVYPGSSATISNNGCMLTSVAVVASSADTSITPYVVFNKYRYDHPRNSINGLAGNYFSCRAGSTKSDSIIKALNKGDVVIIKVYGSKKGGVSKFTSSQHYMALLDIKNGSIFVGNGYSISGHGKADWFSAGEVLTSVQTADYCTPKTTLLNKYK